MSFSTINARVRVRKGAALLDEKGPEGWRNQVDLDKLDTSSIWNCVLGQIYGRWGPGRDALGLDDYEDGPRPSAYGFETTSDSISYGDLDKAWREYLS